MAKSSGEIMRWAAAICEMVGLEPNFVTSLTLEFDAATGRCEITAKGIEFPNVGSSEIMKTWTSRFKVEEA